MTAQHAEYRRLLRLTLDMLHDVIECDGGSGIPLWQIEELASDIGDALACCPEGRTPHTEEWAGHTMYACGCLLLIDGPGGGDHSDGSRHGDG